MYSNLIIKEACCENYHQALKAEKLGANRIELCFDLYHGGTTPSYGCVKQCKKNLKIPIHTIIRPRKGDFIYDINDIEIMKNDIKLFVNELKVDGIVIGLLTNKREIDIKNTLDLINYAKSFNNNLNVTFHMAFDEIANEDNYKNLIDIIINLGCNRILTKGGIGFTNAKEGKNMLKKFIEYSNNKIIILLGGGVTKDNYLNLSEFTGTKEVHGTKIVGILD